MDESLAQQTRGYEEVTPLTCEIYLTDVFCVTAFDASLDFSNICLAAQL
jgi:hypothetical protein